jgi:predicted transcriptional regulator
MGQDEVYKFLQNNKGKKYDSKELCKLLGLSTSSLAVSVKKLYKYSLINREAVTKTTKTNQVYNVYIYYY